MSWPGNTTTKCKRTDMIDACVCCAHFATKQGFFPRGDTVNEQKREIPSWEVYFNRPVFRILDWVVGVTISDTPKEKMNGETYIPGSVSCPPKLTQKYERGTECATPSQTRGAALPLSNCSGE